MTRVTKAVASAIIDRATKAVAKTLGVNERYNKHEDMKKRIEKEKEVKTMEVFGALTLKKGEALLHIVGNPSIIHSCKCGKEIGTEDTVVLGLQLKYPAKKFKAYINWLTREQAKLAALYDEFQIANKQKNSLDAWNGEGYRGADNREYIDYIYQKYLLDNRVEQKEWDWQTAVDEVAAMLKERLEKIAEDERAVQKAKVIK